MAIITGAAAAVILSLYITNIGPIPSSSLGKCDISCKVELEKRGYACYAGSDKNYFCKLKNSAFITQIVIPFGAASMPSERNYIPTAVTISLGINSTVQWTNADAVPHRIVSTEGFFDSGLIYPDQTWTYAFDGTGIYFYRSPEHDWLQGKITVLPIDENYNRGRPIENYGGEPPVVRYLFRETDEWLNIKKVSIINEEIVSLSLLADNEIKERMLRIGDSVLAGCEFVTPNRTQTYYLTLERIDLTNRLAEFRDQVEARLDGICPRA